MAVFQDVVFGFKGEEYTVKSNKIMRLIAMIEDIVTLGDLTSGNIKLSRLAEAYSACLNYAGAETEVETVYETLFGSGSSGVVQESITTLMMLMLPPSSYQPPEPKAAKKPKAPKKKAE